MLSMQPHWAAVICDARPGLLLTMQLWGHILLCGTSRLQGDHSQA